jgi:hypothetical protein
MEVIGIAASIIGIVGAGAKLSVALFDFAGTVGSAGSEVRTIATEISLFCSVLKQLEKALVVSAKNRRYSVSALETTHEILARCRDIFGEIEDVVLGLRGKHGSEKGDVREVSVDLKAKIKWTMKRSRVQLLRATLESCKTTLHIMVTTLQFAQVVASRRYAFSFLSTLCFILGELRMVFGAEDNDIGLPPRRLKPRMSRRNWCSKVFSWPSGLAFRRSAS